MSSQCRNVKEAWFSSCLLWENKLLKGFNAYFYNYIFYKSDEKIYFGVKKNKGNKGNRQWVFFLRSLRKIDRNEIHDLTYFEIPHC